MANLKTDYTDDVLDESMAGKRRFKITHSDGTEETVIIEDASSYLQTGSTYGAADVNKTNQQVNEHSKNLTASDGVPFRFAVNSDGDYGYITTGEDGADTVRPFRGEFSIPKLQFSGYRKAGELCQIVSNYDVSKYRKLTVRKIELYNCSDLTIVGKQFDVSGSTSLFKVSDSVIKETVIDISEYDEIIIQGNTLDTTNNLQYSFYLWDVIFS